MSVAPTIGSTASPVFLGIDIGTSGVKAVALDEAGALLAQATSPLRVSCPHPLWSEQNPDDWWHAVEDAVLAIDPALRARAAGIGVAGQMHGATLLDADDRPLRPAILWNDGRSAAQCREIERRCPESRAITGNMAMPGFTAPKLMWVREHEPALFDRVRTVLLPKDYVRLRMTGEAVSDVSDAAGTLWLDVGAREWSEAMLAACGLSRAHMPRLVEGNAVSGVLRGEVAARWGMPRVPVAGGGGDNAAGAAGIGVVADGDALLSLGTSGVCFVATAAFRPNPDRAVHAFCHCVPGMWHQMAVHLSAASCVDWVGTLLGGIGPGEVFRLAEQAGAAAGPETFLPYLTGERTPHNDPHVRAGFVDLGLASDPGRLAIAVLEGVAFAHAAGLDALRDAGTHLERLAVIGGGARSLFWGSILAAVLGVPLDYLEGGEVGPALGAAKLAQLAVTGAAVADVCVRPPVRATVDPDALLAERLAAKRARFDAASHAILHLGN